MEIVKKIIEKARDNYINPGITIAFFGDSVTQGCFEIYIKENGAIETYFDKNNAYHAHLAKMLSVIYPSVPFNMINAGVSGDNATHALERMDRDVIAHKPDLTVVCFGLNDASRGVEGIDLYRNALKGIFQKLKESGTEIIFMTPNMMNTKLSPHIQNEKIREFAEKTMKIQSDGVFDMYIDAALNVCRKENIKVLDMYSYWKILNQSGVDITELLANKINHPLREMNKYTAVKLLETILT